MTGVDATASNFMAKLNVEGLSVKKLNTDLSEKVEHIEVAVQRKDSDIISRISGRLCMSGGQDNLRNTMSNKKKESSDKSRFKKLSSAFSSSEVQAEILGIPMVKRNRS